MFSIEFFNGFFNSCNFWKFFGFFQGSATKMPLLPTVFWQARVSPTGVPTSHQGHLPHQPQNLRGHSLLFMNWPRFMVQNHPLHQVIIVLDQSSLFHHPPHRLHRWGSVQVRAILINNFKFVPFLHQTRLPKISTKVKRLFWSFAKKSQLWGSDLPIDKKIGQR